MRRPVLIVEIFVGALLIRVDVAVNRLLPACDFSFLFPKLGGSPITSARHQVSSNWRFDSF
jgi:hypothetical protein